MLSALPRCTAKPSLLLLWSLRAFLRHLSETFANLRNERLPFSHQLPTSTDLNFMQAPRAPYFLRLCSSTSRAAQTSLFQEWKHGNTIRPFTIYTVNSHRFQNRKKLSFWKPRLMTLFRAACLGCRPVLNLQETLKRLPQPVSDRSGTYEAHNRQLLL